jgi:hypothetical protein
VFQIYFSTFSFINFNIASCFKSWDHVVKILQVFLFIKIV